MTPTIECHELVRIFSSTGVEVQALQGLDLTVEQGELTAVVGASGSGKSTLLTILSGLDVPSAGRASVAGHDLLAMGRRERTEYRRRTVGFIWQQTTRNLLPYLTAAENIAMALVVARSAQRARGARITELLELLSIGELRDRLPAELSGGQQQRVAIAVALANDPQVLLADEPTGELDEANSEMVLDAFRAINEQLGRTVLIVTHDDGVSDHVRRTVQIRDGRTSTEVLRSTRTDDAGRQHDVAEEFAVLDRVGRLQLPLDYITQLKMRDRVRLGLTDEHVTVSPVRDTGVPLVEPVETEPPLVEPVETGALDPETEERA
ncbi:MAG: ABC transporter ATP-binding protein [Actinomycetota bacterium]|nr:ABC transporter ATP-binding protein [Actinomycetota bacterium]